MDIHSKALPPQSTSNFLTLIMLGYIYPIDQYINDFSLLACTSICCQCKFAVKHLPSFYPKISKPSISSAFLITWYHFVQNPQPKHNVSRSPKLRVTVGPLISAKVHRPQSLICQLLQLVPYRIKASRFFSFFVQQCERRGIVSLKLTIPDYSNHKQEYEENFPIPQIWTTSKICQGKCFQLTFQIDTFLKKTGLYPKYI